MTPDNLLRQAKMTGADYLDAARAEMHKHDIYDDHTFNDCMRLAELMAKDFDTMVRSADMEHLCCSLDRIADSLNTIATSMEDA